MKKCLIILSIFIMYSANAYAGMENLYIENAVPDMDPPKTEEVKNNKPKEVDLGYVKQKNYNLERKKIVNPENDNDTEIDDDVFKDFSLFNPLKHTFMLDKDLP